MSEYIISYIIQVIGIVFICIGLVVGVAAYLSDADLASPFDDRQQRKEIWFLVFEFIGLGTVFFVLSAVVLSIS